MPTEIRRVIFADNELIDAVSRYNNRQKFADRFPMGTVDKCEVRDEQDGIVFLDIRDVDGHHHDVVLQHSMVGAALMQYCLQRQIPLPKRGKKSLQVMGGRIALCIEFVGD